MSTRREGGAEARAAVLARAAEAIAREGYHGTSMRDLAAATGRSLGGLYHLFASKEDLLFEIQRSAFVDLLDSVGVALPQAATADARLRLFIDHHVRYFLAHPAVMRVLVQEASALQAAQRSEIRALKARYYQIAESLVGALLAAQGEDDPADVERLTYCIFGMLNWIFGWYEPARHGSPEELAETIYRLAVHGVTPKGGAPARGGHPGELRS